jgi:serine/threonine protein kinase
VSFVRPMHPMLGGFRVENDDTASGPRGDVTCDQVTVPAGDVAADLVVGADLPATIGPYRLLQRIGEGGMGAVYMAEQAKPVRRKVAIKIIKPGMDSAQVIARFEA